MDRRGTAVKEAEARKEQASELETQAKGYVDSLDEELRAELEAEQARQAQGTRRAGEEVHEARAGGIRGADLAPPYLPPDVLARASSTQRRSWQG